MLIKEYYLVYPEGDMQEISSPLQFNTLVDLNGNLMYLPLKTHKTIVYRIFKITKQEGKGEEITYHHLELVKGDELFSLTSIE